MMRKSRPWSRPIDQMDVWLESQGFYRKHTARDGSCLFRAVAEQLFFTQVYHSDVRRTTVEYILNNPEIFQPMVDEPIDIYAERMRSMKEYGGRVEIEAMSIMFHHDFLMYEEIGEEPEEYTQNGFDRKITLCHSLDRHYDSVFTKDFINKAAFCQSIVYEMLYKSVFELKEVDYAVSKMLHDKTNKQQREHLPFIDCFSIRYEMRDSYTNVRDLLEFGITPFPYKVAKSLDEEVYRNVEYDTWNEYKKGLRYGFCTWSCRELQVGVKCSVKVDEGTTHIGHIQEMSPNKGPVVVYIEKLGEMMTVPYKSLEMLPPSPIIIPPARPSPSLNMKYASLLSTMALRRPMLPIDDPLARRPTKLNLAPRHRVKDDSNKNKSDKPQETRRECQQVHCQQDSKSFNRTDYNQELITDEELHQTHQVYARRANISSSDGTAVAEKTEAVSQIYMPIEGSRNHVYILNTQPISSGPVPVPEARPTLVPVASVPLQVNVMAHKSVNMDGSDLPHSDVSTLRFCYNLGVDCLRMNYLTWDVRPMISHTPHHGYAAIESQPTEDVIINEVPSTEDTTVMQTVTSQPPPTNVEEQRHQAIPPPRIDTSGGRKYDGLPLVQHPEVSSTTPSEPTTPLSPAPYYYPVEYEAPAPLCAVQAPYVEYVYEIGPPAYGFAPYPYHVPMAQDGVIYHPIVTPPPAHPMVTPPPAHVQPVHVPPPHPHM